MLYGRKVTSQTENANEEKDFGEFRRKVKSAEVLSASIEHLLRSLRFTGKVSVVMQNGRGLKSGSVAALTFRHRYSGEFPQSRLD